MSATALSYPWRQALVAQIDAGPRDIVADVGCGTGELAVMLKMDSPGVAVFGLDPKPVSLDRAERRAADAGAMVHFIHATLDEAGSKLAARSPTQIVCSNVLGYLSYRRRSMLLRAMFAALPPRGVIHIADTSRHWVSRLLSGLPPTLSGTSPDGVLAPLRQTGLTQCTETRALPVGGETIHFFRGVKS